MTASNGQEPGRLTRLIATIILIPTVPLLLGSVAALGLFYVAPGRFGALLARLPGEEIVRSMLIFAPATLLAVVVLALLYALDRPPAIEATVAETARRGRGRGRAATAARAMLIPGLPLLILAAGLWLLSFVAPERFAQVIEPLPGDALLVAGLRVAPILLLALVLPAAGFLLFAGRPRAAAQMDPSRPIRWGVGLSLLAAVPLFAFSLLALGAFLFQRSRFDAAFELLTEDTFVRLALIFAPAVLLSLVLLAVLFLFFSRGSPSPGPATEEDGDRRLQRQQAALWVLTSGLAGSAVVVLGLLAVAAYLILR